MWVGQELSQVKKLWKTTVVTSFSFFNLTTEITAEKNNKNKQRVKATEQEAAQEPTSEQIVLLFKYLI